MSPLAELAALCKAGVYVSINPHKNVYETVDQYLSSRDVGDEEFPARLRDQARKEDTLVEVQFYPHTPIGFYLLCDVNVDSALSRALEIVREKRV